MTDWSLWVLDHGLPELPTEVRPGDSVPVALWVGPRFAAVLHVQWLWSEHHDDDVLVNEMEVFLQSDGQWRPSLGSGGSGWFDPPLERPEMEPTSAEVIGQHCSGGGDWYCCAVAGVAGAAATTVEVEDGDGVTSRPLTSPIGAFVACSNGHKAAVVRVRDGNGATLVTGRFGPHSQ